MSAFEVVVCPHATIRLKFPIMRSLQGFLRDLGQIYDKVIDHLGWSMAIVSSLRTLKERIDLRSKFLLRFSNWHTVQNGGQSTANLKEIKI